MNESLTTYFDGEKSAGAMLAGIGLFVLATAGALFSSRDLRAFAFTLGTWGLLELLVGVGLYLKTDPQMARLMGLLANDAAAFYAAERPRMAIVQRNFLVLESLWLVSIVCSAAVAVRWKAHPTTCGIALGLMINTAILLAFDVVAERRGSIYFAALGGDGTEGTRQTVH